MDSQKFPGAAPVARRNMRKSGKDTAEAGGESGGGPDSWIVLPDLRSVLVV